MPRKEVWNIGIVASTNARSRCSETFRTFSEMLFYWPTLLNCAGADSRCVPETPCSEKLQMRAAPCAYSLSALQSRASKRWHRSECGGQQFVILSTLWVICWGGGRKISSISSSIARQFSCTGVTLRSRAVTFLPSSSCLFSTSSFFPLFF